MLRNAELSQQVEASRRAAQQEKQDLEAVLMYSLCVIVSDKDELMLRNAELSQQVEASRRAAQQEKQDLEAEVMYSVCCCFR